MEQKQFENSLYEAETQLDRLKALYEQWFQGFERLEPTVLRKNFDRHLDAMRRELPRNIGLRFRYQQIVQRYTTYMVYWRRIARQIEEGTFNRDLLKARKRRLGSLRPSAPHDIISDPGFDEVVNPARTHGVTDERIRELYERFLAARLHNGERTDNVKLESLEKSVRAMIPKLQEKYGETSFDFEVVVKDGKVGLKPVVG
jgi:hypothetical protein